VFTTDTALGDLFEQQVGAGAAGWYFTSNSGSTPPDSPEWVDFKTRFQSKYGQTPGRAAANAFDLTNLVLNTAAKAGRDRDTIRAAVLKTGDVRGLTGLISFDGAGDLVQWSVDGYRLQGGRFIFADTFTGISSR
jgi:ABC-type branched-subunit amino acid transport system substrate-binding protein